MAFKKCLFVLSGLAWIVMELSGYTASKDMTIRVGKAARIAGDPYTPLKISRRGVLDIEEKDEGLWLITGLKKGFVIIKQFKDNQVIHRWNVSVLEKIKPVHKPLPEPQEQSISIHAVAIVTTSEHENHQAALDQIFQDSKLQNTSHLFQKLAQWSRDSDNRWEMVAEPFLTLLPDQLSIAKTGIEILVPTEASHLNEKSTSFSWKHVGADFSALVKSIKKQYAYISYKIELKSPQVNQTRGFNSHQLSGVTKLNFNTMQLIAKLKLSSLSQSTANATLLRSVPILGPLFQQHQESYAMSELWLVASIQRNEH